MAWRMSSMQSLALLVGLLAEVSVATLNHVGREARPGNTKLEEKHNERSGRPWI